MSSQQLAVEPRREIAIGIEQRNIVSRHSESGHWNETHQNPITDQAAHDSYNPSPPIRPQSQNRSDDVADRNPLQHAINAPRRQVILIRKAIQKHSQSKERQTSPQDMTEKLLPRCSAFQSRTERKCHRHSDDKKKERKHQVSRSPSIPLSMLKRPIGVRLVARVVDQNHSSNRHPAKKIKRHQPRS